MEQPEPPCRLLLPRAPILEKPGRAVLVVPLLTHLRTSVAGAEIGGPRSLGGTLVSRRRLGVSSLGLVMASFPIRQHRVDLFCMCLM
jgi:hypothetical protein